MVRGMDNTKEKKKRTGLTEDKDYLSESGRLIGTGIGEMFKTKKKKSKKK